MAFKVAVIGMSCRFPKAADLNSFWMNIKTGVDAVTPYPMAERWGKEDGYYAPGAAPSLERTYCRRGGVVSDVSFDPFRYGVIPREVEEAEADQFIMLDLARIALEDAGIQRSGREKLPLSVGMILGRTMPIGPVTMRFLDRIKLLPQLRQRLRSSFPELNEAELDNFAECLQSGRRAGFENSRTRNLVPGFAAARLANRLNLCGPSYILDAACASSLIAIENAIMQLQLGRCELMLAGGVHLPLTQGYWSMFSNIGALSKEEQIRPFDNGADGLLLGEGAGLVVLKPLDAALAQGDRIYAVIEGIGSCSDGRAESMLAPFSGGQVNAFSAAWKNADIDPRRVSYIECHGTGMPRGDEVESESLRQFFGPHMKGRSIALGSVKSMIGHTLGAAGIASLIKTACALKEGVLPPSLHCRNLRPDLAAQGFYVPEQSRPWPEEAEPIAGVSAFGFGGINAHLVLSGPPEKKRIFGSAAVRLPRLVSEENVIALSRFDPAALLADLEKGDFHSGTGPSRLVVFNPTPERLAKARRIVARGTPWRGKQDIFFAPQGLLGSGGKLTFLFPGLGNQVNPDFRELALRFGLDLKQMTAREEDRLVSSSLESVFSTNTLCHVLMSLDIVPDAIAGHSLGEWISCVSSGMINEAELGILVNRLLELQDGVMGKGYFLVAAWCGVERLNVLLEGIDSIAVAVDNCPGHTVICGSEASLAEAQQRLRANGILSVNMGIEAASHTPFIRPTLQRIRPLVESISLSPAKIPMWSSSLAGPYPDDDDSIKEVIIENMASPVRFRELVARLYQEGFRAFLQIGNAGLSGFVADTLKGSDFITLDACSQDKTTEQMLRRAAAGLFAEGKTIDFDAFGVRMQKMGADKRASESKASGGHAISLEPGFIEFHTIPDLSAIVPNAPAGWDGSLDMPSATEAYGDLCKGSLDVFRKAQQEVMAALRSQPTAPVLNGASDGTHAAPMRTMKAVSDEAIDPHAVVYRQSIEISHDRFPELYDHEIYQSHAGRPICERSAVAPMTMMIEFACEAVGNFLPGRQIIAVHKVLSFRFIEVLGPLNLEVRIYCKAKNLFAVVVEDRFSCQVEVADSLPGAPALDAVAWQVRNDQPPPFLLQFENIYKDRWLFHGPMYQGVKQLGQMDKNGIAGKVGAAGGKGSLLDSGFQLAGVWFCSHYNDDNVVLPLKIAKIEFFTPLAELRTLSGHYDCRVFTRRITDTEFIYNLELSRNGKVLVRVTDFTGKRFNADPNLFSIFRTPERMNAISAQSDDGLFVFDLTFKSNWTRVMLTKSYLTGREIERVDSAKTINHKNAILRGVVAAKDALKHWLFQNRGLDTLFPTEIEISHDAQGAPLGIVRGHSSPLALSISHKPQIAVAIVGGERRVGIDVESIDARGDAFEKLNYDAQEIEFFDAQPAGERAFWQTLFWTAKEAWGKCQGEGLGGAPRKIRVRDVPKTPAGWTGRVEDKVFSGRCYKDSHVISWVRGN